MKNFLFAAFFVCAVTAAPLFVQQPVFAGNTEDTARLLATVNITNANFVQAGNLFTIAFDISNRLGVQSGIRYGVVLTQATDRGLITVHQRAYDEVLTLGENSSKRKEIVYRVPESLRGEFLLSLVSESESGLRYAYVPIGMVTLGSVQSASVVVDTSSCYLTLQNDGIKYQPLERIIVRGEEVMVSHCTIENVGDTSVSVLPTIMQRTGGIFGQPIGLDVSDHEPIVLAAGERRIVTTEIPLAQKPQHYSGTLSYGTSNALYYQYSILGGSAVIKSVVFDKESYKVGETALLSVYWESSTEITEPHISVIVSDIDEAVCADGIRRALTSQESARLQLTLPITKDCTYPRAEIVIEDEAFGILARQTLFASSPEVRTDTLKTEPTSVPEIDARNEFVPTIPFWISVFGLMVGLIFLVHRAWQERKANAYTTPIPLLFIIAMSAFLAFPYETKADTFLLERTTGPADGRYSYDVTVSTNKNVYSLGEAVQIIGILDYEAPSSDRTFDIRYALDGGTATVLNQLSLQGNVSPLLRQVTINGTLTGLVAGNHTVRIMGPAGSTGYVDLTFTVTALSPCAATVINGCSLPNTNDSGSSGSCYALPTNCGTGVPDGSGSCSWSGSCNYICNNGTWQSVSNACVLAVTPPTSPDLVIDAFWHDEPISPGGDVTLLDEKIENSTHFSRGGLFQSISNTVTVWMKKFIAAIIPPRAMAVAAGTNINLYGIHSNQGTGSTGVSFTNQFSYQFNGTSGAWINIPMVSAPMPLNAGESGFDTTIFSIPYTTGTLHVRYCLDIYDEIAESVTDGPEANCQSFEIFVTAPAPVQCTESINAGIRGEPITNDGLLGDGGDLAGDPQSNYDLLMSEPPTVDYSIVAPCYSYNGRNLTTGISAAAETFAGEPTEVRAIVLNNGLDDVNASFTSLVQVSDTGSNLDAVDVGTVVVNPLNGLAGAIARFNFVFPASAAGTNKFVRVCADKSSSGNSGTIAEANELLGENCGPWNSILIKPACPAGQNVSWTVGGNTCNGTTPPGAKGMISYITDSTPPLTGWAPFYCQVNRTWQTTPVGEGENCSAVILPNLVSENLSVPGSAMTGNLVTVSANSRNISATSTGQGYSNNFSYSWGSSVGPWRAFTPSAYFAKPTLSASTPATNDVYSFSTTTVGTLYIQHCVDSLYVINEGINESPNCMVSPGIVVSAPPATPDLTTANTSPAPNTEFLTTDSVTFTGTANNSNAAPVTDGGWADIEIDWGSDGSFDNLNAFGDARLGAFALGESKNLTRTWDAPPVGTHRYRFNVDTAGELLETDDTNNRSAWVTFTVISFNNQPPLVEAGNNVSITQPTNSASPIGAQVSDLEGTVDSILWSFESGPAGATPNISGENTITPIFSNLDSVGDYTFRVTATDDQGLSNFDTTTVTVVEPPPWATIDADPAVVRAGETSAITWNSDRYTACDVAGVPPSSDNWNGLSGTETTSLLTIDTTYIVTCDGSPRDSVTIQVNPAVFVAVDKYVIRPGEPIEVVWDTNGNDESLCTMEQNGVVTTEFLNGTGSGSKIVNVGSRTRFTLTCDGQTSHADVELRPTVWNS